MCVQFLDHRLYVAFNPQMNNQPQKVYDAVTGQEVADPRGVDEPRRGDGRCTIAPDRRLLACGTTQRL